jgi:hypothetical protein
MKKSIILTVINMIMFLGAYSQELSNEKYQKIIVMDGEQIGWLEIIADPSKFDCQCDDVISCVVKKTSKPNYYKSDDDLVTLQIKGNKYIVTLSREAECCFVKPGTYSN